MLRCSTGTHCESVDLQINSTSIAAVCRRIQKPYLQFSYSNRIQPAGHCRDHTISMGRLAADVPFLVRERLHRIDSF